MIVDGTKLCLNGCFKIKSLTAFGPQKKSPDGLSARCRDCELERIQRGRHGMNRAEKAALATEQGGCAACKRDTPGRKGWVVDHDHACCPGERSCGACRRGILCQWCNSALGYAGDDPDRLRALADYLESGSRIDQTSVERVGRAIRLSESPDRVARTETRGRTNEEPSHQPGLTSSSVSRTRTYELFDVSGARA